MYALVVYMAFVYMELIEQDLDTGIQFNLRKKIIILILFSPFSELIGDEQT